MKTFLVTLFFYFSVSQFLLAQNTITTANLSDKYKKTNKGKMIAPVIDIQPLLVGLHNHERVREEMTLLKELGFERVYMILCNPGYPVFSNPINAIMPINSDINYHMLESILTLGDPNWVYLFEAKRLGMEAWAIIKPYESGGGITIPHLREAPLSRSHIETVGGRQIHFDNLLTDNPEYRVLRKPLDASEKLILQQPITQLEIAFNLDTFEQKISSKEFFQFEGITDKEVVAPNITLWVSKDNGIYTKYDGKASISSKIEYQKLVDANDQPLSDSPKRCLVVRINDISISDDFPYMALTLDGTNNLYTVPYSMIKAFSPLGEVPITATRYVRNSSSSAEKVKKAKDREWGMESLPVKGNKAKDLFEEWGFEFEWYGTGFWGNGWENSEVYGIARGKRQYLQGTPFEGYPGVQEYWLEQVRRIIAMGYDGIDFRLQNHSGMVTDYINYGYNEPIIHRYKEKHGIDILKEKADPLEIMKIRGEYFMSFLKKASNIIHAAGKKMQIHLRHAYEEPKLSDDFNELGFWAMPKVLPNWKEAIDLADEVTIKDYYHNNYRDWMGSKIKNYANSKGKRVWIHSYMQQGNELNWDFMNAVEDDPTVGGILLYEVANSLIYVGKYEHNIKMGNIRGYNQKNVDTLKSIMNRLNYK